MHFDNRSGEDLSTAGLLTIPSSVRELVTGPNISKERNAFIFSYPEGLHEET